MATLISKYTPDESIKASVLTGKPNRVIVEVEDNIDREFWRDLLTEFCPEKELHFNCFQTIVKGKDIVEATGKTRIIKMANSLNDNHIGCVDSDYDWILSDYTDAGKTISGNKHLLQTYAYSIENLMCLPCTLGDFCSENTEETTEFDFEDYLTRLSKAVYPLLVWSTYLCSKGNHDFTPTSWREVLVNTEKDPDASLAIIEAKAKAKIEEFDKKYAEEISDKEDFEFQTVCMKGVIDDEAYLFVRGHDLFDHILYSVLNPVITKLRNQHYAVLRASGTNEETRKIALREYQAKDKPVEKMLSKNYQYKNNTLIYDQIWADVMQIWE